MEAFASGTVDTEVKRVLKSNMKVIKPPYELLDRGSNDWRFQESPEMEAATVGFDAIQEQRRTPGRYEATLRKFLLEYPNHIDGLHHYSICLSSTGNHLESLAFSQTAVATGIRALPAQFIIGKDRLPTGFVENRPFLRALHGLMLAQRNVGLIEEAIATGQMCLALDQQDRMGAREEVVLYLLEANDDETALSLFQDPKYAGTFFSNEYLHALVLIRLGREKDAREVLKQRLNYSPQVARFILNRDAPEPDNDDRWGFVISGSEYEGWMIACRLAPLWRSNRKAMQILRQESKPYEQNGWKRAPDKHA
jgi:tetratricopeptide (TPR) repeat protein